MAYGMLEPRYTLAMVDFAEHRRANTREKYKVNHTYLKELRGEMRGTEFVRDVTEDPRAWRIVCDQQDVDAIVRRGVVKIYAAFLDLVQDTNLHEPRFDLVVQAIDQYEDKYWWARLHPSSSSHGVPVVSDNLSMWVSPRHMEGLGAVDPHATTLGVGAAFAARRREHNYVRLHQTDKISRAQAADYLATKLTEWEARPHPRGPFWQDITDMRDFQWIRYTTFTAWGQGIFFQRFCVAWDHEGDTPCFIGVTDTAEEFKISPHKRAADECQRCVHPFRFT